MDNHNHHQHPQQSGITMAFWLNLLFSIIELAGGILTNSSAILADAFHDFMDAVAIGISVWMEKISGRQRTPKFSYGYKRFSLLSALGLSLFLLFGAAAMILTAIKSIAHQQVVNSIGMLWLAVLGLLINGYAFLKIKNNSGHTHMHNHSHGHSHGENHNRRAIMLHLLEDVLGWAAVLIGSLVIYITGWYWIDGLLALCIAFFISYNAVRNLISTLKVLLQSVPENVNMQNLSLELAKINNIKNIHDLHVWSLDGSYNIGSLHVLINDSSLINDGKINSKITEVMHKHHVQHTTIQFETSIENCKLIDC